jgi:hypothetical protein
MMRGIDVARHLQIEQIGAMLRIVEGIGRGLVDRHRDSAGGGIGLVAGVDGKGFDLQGIISGSADAAGRAASSGRCARTKQHISR